MSELEQTAIALSKTKVILLIFGAIVFVTLGILMLTVDTSQLSNRVTTSPAYIYTIGGSAIIFFGWAGIVGLRKFIDKTPGILLNHEGISINSSGVAIRFVPWDDVERIGVSKVRGQKFVSVFVRNLDKYINYGNFLNRLINKANVKMVGTPINISTNSLKISHDKLLQLIQEYFKLYQQSR